MFYAVGVSRRGLDPLLTGQIAEVAPGQVSACRHTVVEVSESTVGVTAGARERVDLLSEPPGIMLGFGTIGFDVARYHRSSGRTCIGT